MALKHFFTRIWHGKSQNGISPYSGMTGPGPMPVVDLLRKQRPPTPFELVAENVNTAAACAAINAHAVAKTPLRLYLRTGRSDPTSRISKRGATVEVSKKSLAHLKNTQSAKITNARVEEVVDHPLLELLNNPNRDNEDGLGMSLYQLVNYTQLYQEVVGRSYWFTPLDGFGETPSEVWILASQYTREIYDQSTGKIIDRYWFGLGNRGRDYQPTEVVPFRCSDLSNPYTGGVSPMRKVFNKHRISGKIDAKTNALLDNNSMPAALFIPEGSDTAGHTLDNKMRRRLQAALSAKMAANIGGVMVSERSGQMVPLEWPLRDIADFETLKLSKTDIANGYDVPLGLIEPQEQNLTAIQTAQQLHSLLGIEPRCRAMEAGINRGFVSKWDNTGRLFVAFDSSMPDDASEAREETKVLLAAKAATRNEIRARHGLPELDGPEGDEFVGASGKTDTPDEKGKQQK